MKKLIYVLMFLVLCSLSLAHIPDYSSGEIIKDPEISRAFYGVLNNEVHTYTVVSEKDFLLYTNILGPYGEETPKLSIKVYKEDELLFESADEWEYFYEEFAKDEYWYGPEYEENVSAGEYIIEVHGEGKYSLAVGKIEKFDFPAIVKTLFILPWIKIKIFSKPLMIISYLVIIGLIVAGIWYLIRKKK